MRMPRTGNIPQNNRPPRTNHFEAKRTINTLKYAGGAALLILGTGAAVATYYSLAPRAAGNNENHTNGTGGNGSNSTDLSGHSKKSLGKAQKRRGEPATKQAPVGYRSDSQRNNSHQLWQQKNSEQRSQLSPPKVSSNSTEAKNSHGGLQQSQGRGKNGQTSSGNEKSSLTTAPNKNSSAEHSQKPNLRNVHPDLVVSDKQPGANKTNNTSHSVPRGNGKGTNNTHPVDTRQGKELKINDTNTRPKRDTEFLAAAPVDTLEGGAAFLFDWDSAFQQEEAVSSPTVSQPRSSVVETNVRIPKESLSLSQIKQQLQNSNSSLLQSAGARDQPISSGGNEGTKILMLEHLKRLVGDGGSANQQISSSTLNKLAQLAKDSQLSMTDLFRYAAGTSRAELTGKDPSTLSNADLDNLLGPFVETVFFRPGFIANIVNQAANQTLSFSEVQELAAKRCRDYPHAMQGQFDLIHSLSDPLHKALTEGVLSGLSPLFLRNDIEEIGDIKLGSLEHVVTEMGHLQNQNEELRITSNKLYEHGLDAVEDQLSNTNTFGGERNLKFTGGDYLTGEAFVNATKSIDIPDTRNPEIKDNLVLLRLLRENQNRGIRNDAIRVVDNKIQVRSNLLAHRERVLSKSTENVDQLYANNSVSVEKVAAERARAIGYEPTETVQFYQTEQRSVGVNGQSAPYSVRAAINGTVVQAQMIGYDRESGQTGVGLLARTGPQQGQKVWLTQEGLGKEVLKQSSEKLTRLKLELPKQQEKLFRELVPGKPVALYEPSMPWYKLNGLIVEYENPGSTGTSYIGLMRYPDGTWAAAEDIPAGNLNQLQDYVSKNWKNFVNDEPIRFQNGTKTTLPPPTEAELILQTFRGTPEQIVNKSSEPLNWNINALERHVNNTLTEQIKELKTSSQYNLEEFKARLPEFARLAWDIGEGKRMEVDEVFLRGMIGGIEIVSMGTGAGGGIMAERKAAWKQKHSSPSTRQNNFPNPADASVGGTQTRGSQNAQNSNTQQRSRVAGGAQNAQQAGRSQGAQTNSMVRIKWPGGGHQEISSDEILNVPVGTRSIQVIEKQGKVYKLIPRPNGNKQAVELDNPVEISAFQRCSRAKRGTGLSCLRGNPEPENFPTAPPQQQPVPPPAIRPNNGAKQQQQQRDSGEYESIDTPQVGRRNNGAVQQQQQGDSGEYASIDDTPQAGRRNNGAVRQQQRDSGAYTQEDLSLNELRTRGNLLSGGHNSEAYKIGNYVYKTPKLMSGWTENEHPQRVASLWNEFYRKAYNGKYAHLAIAKPVMLKDGTIALKAPCIEGTQASKAQQQRANEELRLVFNREMLDVNAKGNVLVDVKTGDVMPIDFGYVRSLNPPHSPFSERLAARLAN